MMRIGSIDCIDVLYTFCNCTNLVDALLWQIALSNVNIWRIKRSSRRDHNIINFFNVRCCCHEPVDLVNNEHALIIGNRNPIFGVIENLGERANNSGAISIDYSAASFRQLDIVLPKVVIEHLVLVFDNGQRWVALRMFGLNQRLISHEEYPCK